MNTHNNFRAIVMLLFAGVLSACQSTTMSATQDPGVASTPSAPAPVDVMALRDSYIASNPGATSLPLFKAGQRGFAINADNTMVFNGFRSKRRLGHVSPITNNQGNHVCMDALNGWSGACISVFELPDGRIRVHYQFGNGSKGKYIARNLSI